MKPGVIDLAELRERADERDDVLAKAAEQRALEQAHRWDRAMRRAFKGIMPRPEAHRFLLRASQDA